MMTRDGIGQERTELRVALDRQDGAPGGMVDTNRLTGDPALKVRGVFAEVMQQPGDLGQAGGVEARGAVEGAKNGKGDEPCSFIAVRPPRTS